VLKRIGLKAGELDLLDGSPPCFVKGTLITSKIGLKPIEEIRVGEKVLTHTLEYHTVTQTMRRKYAGDLYTITALGALPIECTPEHPLYVRKNATGKMVQNRSLCDPTWVKAEDVECGDYIAIPRCTLERPFKWHGVDRVFFHRGLKQHVPFERVCTLPVDNVDFWWLMGRWVGDGWVRYVENDPKAIVKKKPRHRFFICCDKTDGGHEYRQIELRLDRLKWVYSAVEDRTSYKFSVGGKELVTFVVETFGKGAANKRIPQSVLNLPRPLLVSFFKGYMSADGSKQGNERKLWTVSQKLAVGVTQILARLFGVVGSIRRCVQRNDVIEGRKVNVRDIYLVRYRHNPDKNKILYESEADFIWVPIRDVDVRRFKGHVYNLAVKKDESYVANNIVTHNCTAFSNVQYGDRKWGKEKRYSDSKEKQSVDDLFFEYARLLKGLQPKVFVAENVPGLNKGDAKGYLLEIHRRLTACGYVVDVAEVDASYCGVPQARKRLIFVGVRKDLSKLGFKPVFPDLSDKQTTIKSVLPHVKKIKHKLLGYIAYVDSRRPSPTVTASDATTKENAQMSCGGFIRTKDGETRKYTIPELKKVFSFPSDFVLTGKFEQRWERLGRSVPPLMMFEIAQAIRKHILEPYSKRNTK
jgi:site-specific DNA-cytosine methylase